MKKIHSIRNQDKEIKREDYCGKERVKKGKTTHKKREDGPKENREMVLREDVNSLCGLDGS